MTDEEKELTGMIKEWCESCKGYGFTGGGVRRHKVNECPYCQGKGWVGLEPEYLPESGAIKTNFTITLSGGFRKFAVYIKEIKE